MPLQNRVSEFALLVLVPKLRASVLTFRSSPHSLNPAKELGKSWEEVQLEDDRELLDLPDE